ncbi:hypothetical protein [Methylobacterium nigriterrae]|uniref:hypothetical protein n=1 Tax=Methylobacterium nigriterrae TaxID=3127512 RepID=UPI0030141CA7
MFAGELRAAVEACARDRLPELSAALWKEFSAGAVTEGEAEEICALIEARRGVGISPRGTAKSDAPQRGAPIVRKVQRSPVRSVAVERRRRWAAAGRMPPRIAAHFTTGEQAALAVVAVEVTKRSACTLAIGAIAALAGVSESTVKRALRQARALGLITIQERRLSRFRNDTNVVRIVAREWLSWLELRRSGGGVQSCTGTNTRDSRKGGQRPVEPAQGYRKTERREMVRPTKGGNSALGAPASASDMQCHK